MPDYKNKDFKEHLEHKIEKMRIKQNIKFRAFLINYVAVLIVWLLVEYTPLLDWAAFLMWMSFEDANLYMMVMIGIWKVGAVLMFMMPGLAIWWERHSLKSQLEN